MTPALRHGEPEAMFRCARRLLVLLSLLTALGQAQLVLSVRAGLVHYLDGQVLVANQIVSQDPNRFTRIAEGKTLRTEEGRAEILLGAGSILRVAPFSEVRLLSDDVSQVKVEVLEGSVIVAVSRLLRDCTAEVKYGDATFRIHSRGLYRFDIFPAGEYWLRVFEGQGFLVSPTQEQRLRAGQMVVVANASNRITQFNPSEKDALNEWNEKRKTAIAALNILGKRSPFRARGRFVAGGRATGARRRR